MTANREPECVRIKRRGADYVAQLTDKMTLEEQLIFWQQRTHALRQRQEAKRKRPGSTHRP
jgi:hypothetical protein